MPDSDYKRGSISIWENSWGRKKQTLDFDKPINDWDYFDSLRAKYLADRFIPKDRQILTLEAGCGSASVSTYFALKGARTVMLDASASALKAAQANFDKYGLKGEFVNGNMEKLPFPDEKFDLVMSFGVLEHFEDMRPSIKEMARVLKPGGIFFAAVSPKKRSIQALGDLVNMFMRFLYNLKHGRIKEAFFHSYPAKPEFYENSLPAKDYAAIVEQCGIKDVELSGCRPFPSLDLPEWLFGVYIGLMGVLRPLHMFFDTHPSKLTEIVGVEWNIVGVKK
jgi:ubiquinone/menaquinone biosynthesis C-methylase UbiE